MLDKASQEPKTMVRRDINIMGVLNRFLDDSIQAMNCWLGKAKPTGVWWDMNTCPVPDGYDARMVSQCIERGLKKAGHSGPLTITAFGNLKQTLKRTPDVLPAISSTGIHLRHFAYGNQFYEELLVWTRENPPPANIMLITGAPEERQRLYLAISKIERDMGYTFTVFHVYPQPASYLDTYNFSLMSSRKCSWESLLKDAIDSGEKKSRRALEEKLCETGGSACSFFCALCKFAGQSCEDFTSHLRGRDHIAREVDLLPWPLPKRKLVKPIFTISKYLNKQRKGGVELWIEEDRMSL